MTLLSSGALIGVIHLPPLPGSPAHTLSMDAITQRAVADAQCLADAGFDAAIVENLGDVPFAQRLGPASLACMAVITDAIRRSLSDGPRGLRMALGINALRNDPLAALGIAVACGASFIRVNVLTGVVATDQGLIQGQADEVLRYRRLLGASIAILADIMVKHAVTLHVADITRAAHDTAYRGLADGLIVTGEATGRAADIDAVRRAKQAVPNRPVFVGSGVTADTVGDFLQVANGVIVGSALKPEGDTTRPVDARLAAGFVASARRGARH